MKIKKERLKKIFDYVISHGTDDACKAFNISLETLNRYEREYKRHIDTEEYKKLKSILNVLDKFSLEEINCIAKSGKSLSIQEKIPPMQFDGDEITFAHITDTHIGSKYFHENLFDSMVEELKIQNVDFVCHTGDLSEGFSNREDHIYEVTHLGYDKQKEYCIELLNRIPVPIYCIDGNHDRWFIKRGGAMIVKDVCDAVENAVFVGHDEGDLPPIMGVKIKMWHGIDSASRNISHRPQDLCDSFSDKDKPHVLLCGHTHKMGYFFIRNIHSVSGGAIQLQTKWMRGKKIKSHSGFWIIKMKIKNGIVKSFNPTWYPFYK